MRGRIIRRVSAKRDLLECFVTIGESSEGAALRFLEAAENTLQLLAARPGIGKRTDFSHPVLRGTRRFPISGFEKYLVFYRPIRGGVEVLRVIHGARDIDSLFGA